MYVLVFSFETFSSGDVTMLAEPSVPLFILLVVSFSHVVAETLAILRRLSTIVSIAPQFDSTSALSLLLVGQSVMPSIHAPTLVAAF